MSGWIKLHRSICENPYWLDEPFTRGQAWVDLLLLANSKHGHIRKQGIKIPLDRGDVGASENGLSARWMWSRGKVRRFLEELENDEMITRNRSSKTDKRTFVLTIVNYSKFQDKVSTDGTSDDTGDSTSDGTSDGQATVQEQESKEVRKKEYRGENKKAFSPPTVEEVKDYCSSRGNSVNPEKWFDFYASKGWMIGKNKMKDWKAAVRTWEKDDSTPQQKEKCPTCEYQKMKVCHKTEEQRKTCTAWKEAM